MRYNALEIARYIISRCSNAGSPVSNLKLQKMLYFLWVDFYRITGRMLFLDDICAWKLGPVVPNVYYEYCSYAGRPIFAFYSHQFDDNEERIMAQVVDEYMNVSANELVSRTHQVGTAWDMVYQGGRGNRNVIPFSLIIAKEVG